MVQLHCNWKIYHYACPPSQRIAASCLVWYLSGWLLKENRSVVRWNCEKKEKKIVPRKTLLIVLIYKTQLIRTNKDKKKNRMLGSKCCPDETKRRCTREKIVVRGQTTITFSPAFERYNKKKISIKLNYYVEPKTFKRKIYFITLLNYWIAVRLAQGNLVG